MPDDHFSDHSDDGTSEGASHVPGLNQIGARLDDLGKNIQQNQRWALKDWVSAAKLLVIVADVHGLKGDDYVQFACAHLPLEGTAQSTKRRAAYDLYILGYAKEGQPANGDLIIQECEAQAKLRPHNFEWPHWRTVTARLRRAAQETEQGDGVPAGEDAKDAPDADAPAAPHEDTHIDPIAEMDADNQRLRAELDAAQQSFKSERATREEAQDELHRLQQEAKEKEQGIPAGEDTKDAPDAGAPRVDPVAQMNAENQQLRAELDAARQSFESERARREEVQDALHRLRSDITRVLSVSEKALWDTPPPEPPHTPEPEPEQISEMAPEPEPETEPQPETLLEPEPETSSEPELLDMWEALDIIYSQQQRTCQSVADVLRQCAHLREWNRDDFDGLKEALDDASDWLGDRNDMAHTLFAIEEAPILFGNADGVVIYEDSDLKCLTWAEALARIAPELEEVKHRRELERREQEMQRIARAKLPGKRKLRAMKALLHELMALPPTTIGPEAERAMISIGDMTKDDARFAGCRTFDDYVRKAAEITAPPEPPKVLMLPPPEPPALHPLSEEEGDAETHDT